MFLSRWFREATEYIAGAMTRIFGPTDDQYPATGVQPFSGEPAHRRRHRRRHQEP